MTDNRNRTARDPQPVQGGALGQPGSVGFFFNHLGVVEATPRTQSREIAGRYREAGAQEVEPLEPEVPAGHKGARFLMTEIKDRHGFQGRALKAAGWTVLPLKSGIWPKNFTELDAAARKGSYRFP